MMDCILFYLNGSRFEVTGAEAASTLSDYLRQSQHHCGTKIACAEGDCGACTVLVGRLTEDGEALSYVPIDSCIAFVYQMHLRHVVTVEGLAHSGQLSTVQKSMVDCHGSQCGFCTPGFVMALHGMVEAAEAPLTEEQLRLGLSGNLCRCTGYSQILDAGLELQSDQIPSVGEQFDTKQIVQELSDHRRLAARINATPSPTTNGHTTKAVEVMIPQTLPQLLDYRASHPNAKLVAGATDIGVQYNHGRIAPEAVIYLGQVEELHRFAVEKNALSIGAALRWTDLELCSATLLPEFRAVIERFGSPQVRQAGTLVGNLANGSPIADSIPLLYVAEAILELASKHAQRAVPITEFYQGYKQLDLASDEVITGVRIPLPTDSVGLKLYKISKRRDMDISTVTAAFWIELDGDRIIDARIAFGGVGPTVLRMPKSEEALKDRTFTLEILAEAGIIARGEVTPISDVRGDAAYRHQLVENLFSKCYYDLNPQPATL